MANYYSLPKSLKPSLIIIFFIITTITSGELEPEFWRTMSPTELGIFNKQERLTHLHFYFHDITGGINQTAVRVAGAAITDTSLTEFGAVVMVDDPLTEAPELGSKVVGRAQGMYGFASQTELGLLMVLSFVFTEGKYNGSTVSVLGRNTVESAVREMPIVGGSGAFRFSRGYALAKTHSFSVFEAVVEYDIYVFHY